MHLVESHKKEIISLSHLRCDWIMGKQRLEMRVKNTTVNKP